MASRFEEIYRFKTDDLLTDEELNKRFKDLDGRLAKAEVARLSEDEAFAVVLDRVLGRSEAVIASLRDQLLEITQLQWLTAGSDTPQTLAVEAQFALSIIEEHRALFAPGPYALLSWTGGAPDDYAIVRTLAFDRQLGQWDVRVEAFVGDPGPWNDWQIAAVAGATLAQMALLDQGQADRADVVAKHEDIVERHADITAKHGQATAARDQALPARDQAVAAAVALFPSDFQLDGAAWTNVHAGGAPSALADYNQAGAGFVTDATYGRVLQSTAFGQVLTRGALRPKPGRRYRIEARIRAAANSANGNACGCAVDFYGYDAAYAVTGSLDANSQAVAGLSHSEADLVVADGLITLARDYVAPANPPAFIRPRLYWNYGGAGLPASATIQVVDVLLRDVTDAHNAAEAAASVDAARADVDAWFYH